MKMWSIKVIILLLFCYACLSIDNRTVYFDSRNFNNILRWNPVKPAFPGEKVTYSVQCWSDTEEQVYHIKKECENITALSCDLTAETPSLHDVHYQARVFVKDRMIGRTNRFKPIAETILGEPQLSIHKTVSSLHVNVTLPLGPNGVSIADIITKSKNGPSKTVMHYTLKITHPKWAQQVSQNTIGRFVIKLKNNHTKYCGYVVYKPHTEWGRSESENATFCETLPDDPLKLLPWFLLSATLLVIIAIMTVACMCNYVKGGKEKSMPPQLVPTSSTQSRILQTPDEKLIISKAEICTQSDRTVCTPIQVKPKVPPVAVGGYSPQDVPFQAWPGSTGSSVGTGSHSPTPNPEDTSAQSYSVVAVHTEEKDIQQSTINNREQPATSNRPLCSSGESLDEGAKTTKLSTYGVPQLHDPDSCESNPARPLLLHTVRASNGQLMLPSLTFQLQSSSGETERKPLLSDLIDSKMEGPSLASLQSLDGSEWSDSGCDDSSLNTPTQAYCNTHYFPSQPVVPYLQQGCQNTPSSGTTFESGYKQNWMPAIFLGTASKDSCEYRGTNYPCT